MTNNNETPIDGVIDGAVEQVVEAKEGVATDGASIVEPEENALTEIEALREALEKAEEKATVNYDLALRVKAEAENARRRQETDVSNARKYGVEKFAVDLLPVLDSMEMGLSVATDDNADVTKFREGSEMAIKMFISALEKIGAEIVDPKGKKFNPEHHQAMSMVENHELAPNTVMNVVQKGYLLHGRLMRPAMVIVSKGGPTDTPSNGSIDEIV